MSAKTNKAIRHAAIAGIWSLVFIIPTFILEAMKKEVVTMNLKVTTLIFYIITLVVYILFIRGFVVIAKKTKDKLLLTMSYLCIITTILYYIYVAFVTISPALEKTFIHVFSLMVMGGVSIPFGISIINLKKKFKGIATAAGVLNIITGSFFITIIFVFLGFFTMIATYILEIILLFRASEKLK
ncbi:hypothetical protein KY360_03705 [Candidatus Woesearchaeota archaeon]|nr:hypothetical protein [Candidatus Woesearchaeota archaeon]